MQPTVCIATCKSRNYRYDGVQWGNECWCGNSKPDRSPVTDAKCRDRCDGNSRLWCGDSYHMNIYGPLEYFTLNIG